MVGWEILSDTQNTRVPAVDPSVMPGTCYSIYMDRHEMETAAHSLAGQSELYHKQRCDGTGLSCISGKSLLTLLVTMKW